MVSFVQRLRKFWSEFSALIERNSHRICVHAIRDCDSPENLPSLCQDLYPGRRLLCCGQGGIASWLLHHQCCAYLARCRNCSRSHDALGPASCAWYLAWSFCSESPDLLRKTC